MHNPRKRALRGTCCTRTRFKSGLLPLAALALAACGQGVSETANPGASGDGRWNGTIIYTHRYDDKGATQQDNMKDEWIYCRKADLKISVKDGEAYGVMKDVLRNWQKNTSPFAKDMDGVQIVTVSETGGGEGEVEVWIEFDEDTPTYWLKSGGPDYSVARTTRTWSNIIEMAGQPQPEEQTTRMAYGIPIDVPDQPVGANPDVLTGQFEIRIPVAGMGENLTTIRWGLVKGTLDQDLVEAPEDSASDCSNQPPTEPPPASTH